jgi:hypothetical protein
MKRLMIGQFNKYNEDKQKRDFRSDFFGVEVCQMESEEDIEIIDWISKKDVFKLGIHFPLRTGQWRLRDPQYLSENVDVIDESFDYMEREFKYSMKIKPYYILIHYPKPVIIDDNVDWSRWRFADETEYYYESRFDFDLFEEKSEIFFQWLSDKGKEYNFIPILELDAVNKYIYNTDLLDRLLVKYPNIKLCLDIGRIHLQDMIDESFSGYVFVERFAKYAELVHLWNVQVETSLKNNHYPVLPSQDSAEGWADVQRYINIITKNNSEFKVLFEHRSDLISDEELDRCYEWIKSML